MSPFMPKKSLLALAASGLLAVSFGAAAQERPAAPETQPASPEQTPKEPMPKTQYDSDTLDGFVDAYDDVQDIHQKYVNKLDETDDPSKATELQREAQSKIEETVQSHGLSMNEYHQIVGDYRNDPELRERINDRM